LTATQRRYLCLGIVPSVLGLFNTNANFEGMRGEVANDNFSSVAANGARDVVAAAA